MKPNIIFLIVVFFAGGLYVSAQADFNGGLVLRGTDSNWQSRELEDHVIWTAKLRMEFFNEGKSPIILISPNREFGKWQKEVIFTDSVCRDEKKRVYVECDFVKSSDRKLENRKDYLDLVSFLDVERPPENVVLIIEPGDSVQFEDKFEIKQSFKQKESWYDSREWEGPGPGAKPLFDYKKIKISYQISLVKYQKDPDLLEKLQGRWRRFGYFPVDINGGFSITSEFLTRG